MSFSGMWPMNEVSGYRCAPCASKDLLDFEKCLAQKLLRISSPHAPMVSKLREHHI